MTQLARNVISTYVSRATAVMTLLLLFPFVVRHVGLEQYGIWLLISSFTWLFMTDLGIGTSAARYVAEASARKDWDLASRTLTTGLVCFVGVGLGALVIFGTSITLAWGSLNIRDADRDMATVMVAIAGVGYLLLGLPLSLFRNVLAGLQRYDVANGIHMAQSILRLVVTIIALLAGGGIMAVLLIDVSLTLVSGSLMMLASLRLAPNLKINRSHFDKYLARSVAAYSLQVFVLGASGLIILQADNLLIGLYLPVAAVSLYSGAFRIYQFCREVTGPLMAPLVPDAAEAGTTGDMERLRELLLHGTRMANGALCAVAVPAALLARPILVLWAGPPFESVSSVTQILIVGLLINNCHLVALPLMVGLGEVRRYAALHTAWALSNIALTLALIGPLELRGVALGTTLPLVVLEPLYVQTALRRLDITAREFLNHALVRGFGPAAPLTLLFAVGVALVEPRSWLAVSLAASGWLIVYGVAFSMLCLRPQDRTRFRRAIRARLIPAPAPGEAA